MKTLTELFTRSFFSRPVRTGVWCLVSCVFLATIIGCGTSEKPYSPNEAENKLIAFCKKEGAIDISTRLAGKTQWIYLPLEIPLFEIKSSSKNEQKADRRPMPFSLLSLEGEFTGQKNFSMTYDIVPDVLPGDPSTYGMAYNEEYTKKKQLIYQGLQETFFALQETEAPVFFVIVIADITKGIATKNTLYLQDLKEFMTGAIYEEYYFRELSEILGDKDLIGDKKGRFLKYTEVTWPDFLTDQIESRIRFKFTQSDFKPKTEPDQTIARIAANTLRLYPFSDYEGVYLYNRRDKKELLLNKEQLKGFEEGPGREEQKGRTTVLHFTSQNGLTLEEDKKEAAPSSEAADETTLP